MSEQKGILERQENRQLLERVKDDSSSLVVLWDASSLYSKPTLATDRSSQLSRVFPNLDAELMSTAVYQKAVRSLFKRSTRRSQKLDRTFRPENSPSRPQAQEAKQGAMTSKNINTMLLEDQQRTRGSEINFALLGTSEKTITYFLSQLETTFGLNNRPKYRPEILTSLVESMQSLLKNLGTGLDASLEEEAFECRQQALPLQQFTPKLASALRKIRMTLAESQDRNDLIMPLGSHSS